MRLTKTSWLVIIIGVFIIMFAGLGAVRYQQVRQQNQLTEELASAQSKLKGIQLEQLSNRQEELEQQLSQTISQSEATKSALSQPIQSITISDTLFDIAEANSVNVMEVSTSGLASEELAGITYSVLPLTARVEGELTNLASFITQLNGEFETGVIKSVEINVPEATSRNTIANIQMVIYAYQGD